MIRSDTVVGKDSAGSFEIDLDPWSRFRPGRTYWISTQANMDFQVGGQWGAELASSVDGDLAVWKNPGDGFATRCVDRTPLADCIDDFDGNLVFEINTGRKVEITVRADVRDQH